MVIQESQNITLKLVDILQFMQLHSNVRLYSPRGAIALGQKKIEEKRVKKKFCLLRGSNPLPLSFQALALYQLSYQVDVRNRCNICYYISIAAAKKWPQQSLLYIC